MEPARCEAHRVCRRVIEPLCIVDDDEHGVRLSGRGEQPQQRGAHREAVALLGRPQTENGAESGALSLWDLGEEIDQRPAELEQPRELDLGLRLDPGRRDHRHRLGEVDGVPQQRRLADARLAADHKRAALTATGVGEQALDPLALGTPPDEHRSMVLRCLP